MTLLPFAPLLCAVRYADVALLVLNVEICDFKSRDGLGGLFT